MVSFSSLGYNFLAPYLQHPVLVLTRIEGSCSRKINECSGREDTALQNAQCYPISIFPKFESWNFGGRAPAVKKIGRREGGGCTS